MMRKTLTLLICFFVFYGISFSAEGDFVVVIDPGHGGRDGGAVRGTYREKNINLGVALELGKLLEAEKGVKVTYTRKTDVFIDLDRRTKIANKAKANLFISIHTNSTAAKTTTASGADTYILGLAKSAENLEVAKRENSVILLEDDYSKKYEGFDPKSPESYIIFEFMTNKYMEQSLQFATFVQKDFAGVAKRKNRGVRQAGFLVLRESGMPSVLIELGFINNPTEAKYLASKAGQKAMADAIFSGFKKYKKDFDKMQSTNKATAQQKNAKNAVKTNATAANINNKNQAKTVNNTKTAKSKGVEYRVQFLYSDNKLSTKSSRLKGLSPVGFYKEGNGYKYTYGSTTDYSEIVKLCRQIKPKFGDAFVIRFKDGSRVR